MVTASIIPPLTLSFTSKVDSTQLEWNLLEIIFSAFVILHGEFDKKCGPGLGGAPIQARNCETDDNVNRL